MVVWTVVFFVSRRLFPAIKYVTNDNFVLQQKKHCTPANIEFLLGYTQQLQYGTKPPKLNPTDYNFTRLDKSYSNKAARVHGRAVGEIFSDFFCTSWHGQSLGKGHQTGRHCTFSFYSFLSGPFPIRTPNPPVWQFITSVAYDFCLSYFWKAHFKWWHHQGLKNSEISKHVHV